MTSNPSPTDPATPGQSTSGLQPARYKPMGSSPSSGGLVLPVGEAATAASKSKLERCGITTVALGPGGCSDCVL
jgi:hypothetical protein